MRILVHPGFHKTGTTSVQYGLDRNAAVLADRVVTAAGTAPVSFMGAVLDSLGLKSAELDAYLSLFGAEHLAPVSAA